MSKPIVPTKSTKVTKQSFMIRSQGVLDAHTESIVSTVINCGFIIHRELGSRFVEIIYRRAMCLELALHQVPFECEKSILVRYREHDIPGQRIDLLVAGKVIVEIKAQRRLEDFHQTQLISYLKTTGIRVGLLMNFGATTLREGLKRFVV